MVAYLADVHLGQLFGTVPDPETGVVIVSVFSWDHGVVEEPVPDHGSLRFVAWFSVVACCLP